MTIRTTRERLLQALGYETGGLLVATPVCIWLTGSQPGTSVLLLVVLSALTFFWAPLFNTLFDRAEWRWQRRPASDRPKRLRLLHALALEVSDMVISVPVLMFLGGLALTEALVADLGLTLVYAAYNYAYHQVFDWLRPVTPQR